jgi:hypothetical protein
MRATCELVQSPVNGLWEVTKACGFKVAPEFCHGPEAKGGDAKRPSCSDILVAVVDEDCFVRLNAQPLEAVAIDGGVWLDDANLGRENLVIEVAESRKIRAHVRDHVELHVR